MIFNDLQILLLLKKFEQLRLKNSKREDLMFEFNPEEESIYEVETVITRETIKSLQYNGLKEKKDIIKKIMKSILRNKKYKKECYSAIERISLSEFYKTKLEVHKSKQLNKDLKSDCSQSIYFGDYFLFSIIYFMKNDEKLEFFKENYFLFLRLLFLHGDLIFLFNEKEILDILKEIPNNIFKLDMMVTHKNYNKSNTLTKYPKIKNELVKKIKKESFLEILNDASKYDYNLDLNDKLDLDDLNVLKSKNSYYMLFAMFIHEYEFDNLYLINPLYETNKTRIEKKFSGFLRLPQKEFEIEKKSDSSFKVIINEEFLSKAIKERNNVLNLDDEDFYENLYEVSKNSSLNIVYSENNFSYISNIVLLLKNYIDLEVELKNDLKFKTHKNKEIKSYDFKALNEYINKAKLKQKIIKKLKDIGEKILIIIFIIIFLPIFPFILLDNLSIDYKNAKNSKLRNLYNEKKETN